MKKTFTLLLFILSFQAFSQGLKDRIFTNFSFSAGADLNFGPLHEVNYSDVTTYTYKGYSKDFAVGILSYQYGLRLNVIEKGPDFSLGIWVPITASISAGKLSYLVEGSRTDQLTGKTELVSESGKCSTFGRVSFPVFLQFGFGGGSTYKSDKEKGFTAGIGVDMSLSPLYFGKTDTGGDPEISIKRFNIMPAVNIGRRKFQKDEFVEYNLKFGYVFDTKEYKNQSDKLSTPGMVIMLTIGKILNY
ncbi:MAG: hypothetical protein CFE21_10325 [Bacteroidetes bacterium B1(2017)]|nr:MAG: hypothetical protein CFE21_10325 [Bacteroidetes bacterium B1(2017)]